MTFIIFIIICLAICIVILFVFFVFHSFYFHSQWDIRTTSPVKKVELESTVTSMELSTDLEVLVVTYGKTVAFYNPKRYVEFHV